MNKYETLFNDILKQTKLGKLKWAQVDKRSNSQVIFNSNLVFRQYKASYLRNEEKYFIILVEKKFEDPNFDFAFESYEQEVLVLDADGELLVSMTDNLIEKKSLETLSSYVEENNDRTSSLFKV